MAGSLLSLTAADIHPRLFSPKRSPAEPGAASVCTADPLVFVRELCSGKGIERQDDLDVALVREREHEHMPGVVDEREGSQARASGGMRCGSGVL
jgi:hypothetical protein